jgi:DNA-binding transcriptional ArsR family regulator
MICLYAVRHPGNRTHTDPRAANPPKVKMWRPQPQDAGITGPPSRKFRCTSKSRMEKIIVLAQAIACPSRLGLYRLLGERGLSLTEAARRTGLAPSTACHHLAQLVTAGLAVKAPKGREAIYRWSRSRWQFVRERPPAPTMPPSERESP